MWAFPIHRYPAEMAGDLEPEPLCSIGVSSWSARGAEAGFDMIASVTQRSRWRPLPGASGEGFGQERSGSAKTRSQCLLLQWDARELSLHEIELVCDYREVRARLIEIIQY